VRGAVRKGGPYRDLQIYCSRRNEYCPKPKSEAMFLSRAGTRIGSSNLGSAFGEVLERAGMTTRLGDKRPRLGDLRHTFAVRTLATWHNQGLEIEPLLPLLSTVMGHVSPASTYWYLSQCPELLGAAARRLEMTRGGPR
jgi:integrase/recombinase XerD